jgi:hypothetical protein
LYGIDFRASTNETGNSRRAGLTAGLAVLAVVVAVVVAIVAIVAIVVKT